MSTAIHYRAQGPLGSGLHRIAQYPGNSKCTGSTSSRSLSEVDARSPAGRVLQDSTEGHRLLSEEDRVGNITSFIFQVKKKVLRD